MIKLLCETKNDWLTLCLDFFDDFLTDHAQAEKKASGMAMSMVSHYPDRPQLVTEMIELAIEELTHFREVVKLMQFRGVHPGKDTKDAYVNQFRTHIRSDSEDYLLDRLLVASIVEARGCERFGLIGEHHPEADIRHFYQRIATSEAKHQSLFSDLATMYFSSSRVKQRADELLNVEHDIIQALPLRPALH